MSVAQAVPVEHCVTGLSVYCCTSSGIEPCAVDAFPNVLVWTFFSYVLLGAIITGRFRAFPAIFSCMAEPIAMKAACYYGEAPYRAATHADISTHIYSIYNKIHVVFRIS